MRHGSGWRASITATLIVASMALSGCAGSGGLQGGVATPEPLVRDTSTYGFSEKRILLSDGRTVTCILYDQATSKLSRAGLSCDWDNAEGTQ